MKATFVPSVLLALSGLAASSPVTVIQTEAEAPLLAKRASGTLKAWTGSGSACSGNPGFSWSNPGQNQCIEFKGSNGQAKTVHRLSWSGQACQVYGYSSTGCKNEQSTVFGGGICFVGASFLSFKVVC